MAVVRNARRVIALCAGLAFVVGLLVVPTLASAMPVIQSGGISGVVRDSSGVNGLANIRVELYDATSSVSPTTSVYTDALGNYAFAGLRAPRSYYMRLSDNTAPYLWAPEFYKHHFGAFADLGDPIAVSVGATQSINPTMTAAAVVNGVVHRKGHPETVVEGATLHLLWMGEDPQRASIDSLTTHTDGTFDAMRGLFPGPYMFWVYFRPDVIAPLYGPSLWNSDTRTLSAGTTTTVDLEVPLKPVTVSNVTPGWHKAPFVLQLTVADGDIPPFTSHIYFGPHALDADLDSLNFASDTSQTVWFWSRDASGNVESTKSVDVRVDATPPETTCTATPGASLVNLVLSAHDDLSGVGGTYYKIDGGAAKTYSGPAAMPAGPHDVAYWSEDAVGNAEAAQTLHIVNPPAVAVGKPSASSSVKRNQKFTVSGSISPDQKKGDRSTKLYVYRSVGGTWKLYKTVWTTSVRSHGKSRYSASIRLTTKGSFKLVAYSPGTYCGRWPGFSAAKFLKVK